MTRRLSLVALPGLPRVEPGDDLAALIADAAVAAGEPLADGDIVVVAQKIVSKAEGRYVELADVTPGPRARELGAAVDKDPRLVEVILSESTEVVRHRPGVLVVAHRSGVVLANAGIDQSNIEHHGEGDRVLLLPIDADHSAADLRAALARRCGVEVAVVINDSLGRAWRNGTVGVALGAAGLPALEDLRGQADLFGRTLQVTEVGTADQLASAAALLQGQADEGTPVVVVRGLCFAGEPCGAAALIRSRELDLFR